MDPPKRFGFNFDYDGIGEKLKYTLIAFSINSFIILSLITIAQAWLNEKQVVEIIIGLKNSHPSYFNPLNFKNFLYVLEYIVINAPLVEESLYRYLPLTLVRRNFKIKDDCTTKQFILILCLVLNYLWTMTHSAMPWPIFVTGLTLYWVTLKTRSLLPAIFCHAASNLGLYIVVQSMMYFHYDPLMKAVQFIEQLPAVPE